MSEQTTSLVTERKTRLTGALAESPFDAFLAVSAANLLYATGYRSLGASVHGTPSSAAFVTTDRTIVAGPVADSAPALEWAIEPDDFVPYGRFYFESDTELPAAYTPDAHATFADAMTSAATAAGLDRATIGVDEAALNPATLAQLTLSMPNARFVDASGWALGVRSKKFAGECALLQRAARITEDGISAAIENATVGTTELELAGIVSSTIARTGAEPKFISVSSGPRSAFADAFPTDRAIRPGDLVRFDVGCIDNGYWSDIGRTAVVGEPNVQQTRCYDAIFEGEQQQLDRIRAGVTASEIFGIAMDTVERNGIQPYRRQHCGHGIGLDVYEPPIINAATDTVIEAGMTFCLETPYYVVGWGGMMVEDTIVVTEDGHTALNVSDRRLRVIPV